MKRPYVGLGVIIMKDNGQVLLGKRKGSHGAGTWAFPGGHLEYMEELEDCAKREVKEETGLGEGNIELIDENPITVTNDFFKREDKHYVTLFMRAKYLFGEPKRMEPDKCEGWEWFYWDNLPHPLYVSTKNLIKQKCNSFTKYKWG